VSTEAQSFSWFIKSPDKNDQEVLKKQKGPKGGTKKKRWVRQGWKNRMAVPKMGTIKQDRSI